MRKLLPLLLIACHQPHPIHASPKTTVAVVNGVKQSTKVYANFGADSKVVPDTWKAFCTKTANLSCNFEMEPDGMRELPAVDYLNVTLSFNGEGCGSTKAELNVNNPKWYDILDVSLVDGYSNALGIEYTPPEGAKTVLGPPMGATGNEELLGVYPLGCDTCVERTNPPCGIPRGRDGCKKGTQYAPIPPCQFQGATLGGGGRALVIFGLQRL